MANSGFHKINLKHVLRCIRDTGWKTNHPRQHRCFLHSSACVRQDKDAPVRFSQSEAARWSASETFSSSSKERPFYQPLSVGISTFVFLIYFCLLREENDLDEELSQSLFERIPVLEEQQIKVMMKYNKEQGLSTKDLETRLEELKAPKSAESEES
ncbi:hypothetical protein ScPMuIL_003517 [Solemya velum]